jgi:hypothetical protein
MDLLFGWLMAVSVAYLHVDLVVARWWERSSQYWHSTGEPKFTMSEKAGFCFTLLVAFCIVFFISAAMAHLALDRGLFGLGALAIIVLSLVLLRQRIINVSGELEFKKKLES